ncbi:hypothetical protein D1007_46410 [Hordeum vulgare]|nr:hypothetical protein D1007_46410 [Hordeum vulgare]
MPPNKKYTFPHPATTIDSSQPKQRKPMPRPAGVSNDEWKADVQHREAVITDRQRRLDAKKIRDAAEAAAAAVDQEEFNYDDAADMDTTSDIDDKLDDAEEDKGEEEAVEVEPKLVS